MRSDSSIAAEADPGQWVPASARLVKARIITSLIVTPVPIAVGAVLATLVSPWWWLLVAPFTLGLLSTLLRSRRYVASLGHCEQDEQILVREGLWSRTTTLVPYGRLQRVELTEGPIDARFGLAKLQIHTATGSGTGIPGLEVEKARALRARLVAHSRGRDEGL